MNANDVPEGFRAYLPAPLVDLLDEDVELEDEDDAFYVFHAITAVFEAKKLTWTDVVKMLNEIGGPITRYATTEPPHHFSECRFSRASLNSEPIPSGGFTCELDLNEEDDLWLFVDLFLNHPECDTYYKADFVFVVRSECPHCVFRAEFSVGAHFDVSA